MSQKTVASAHSPWAPCGTHTALGDSALTYAPRLSQILAGEGLGHIPEELPSYQDELVRLYKKGTPVGQLIDAVLSPGEQNDISLSERFSSEAPDYAAMVGKIRDIVGE